MKIIYISNNKQTIVDDEDYENLNKYRWTYHPGGYAYRHKSINGKITKIYLHRFIFGITNKMHIDHIDGNGLNNQKLNLRICTNQQNSCNQKTQNRIKYSKYKGVSWDKSKNKWIATIHNFNKQYFLGRFNSEIEAALAYNKSALLFHGDFAKINII